MTKPLSPAAQVVLKTSASAACLQHWGTVNDPPCHPSDDGWNGCGDCVHRSAIAAALRAAAKEMVPKGPYTHMYFHTATMKHNFLKLMAIADELDGSNV